MTRPPSELLAEYEPVIGLEVHVQLATHRDRLRGTQQLSSRFVLQRTEITAVAGDRAAIRDGCLGGSS
ncbi:hypothetical protein BH11MYX2_BH11MYX2_16180 [soil metagenome]